MAKKRASVTSDNNSNPAASFKNEVILWAVLAVSIILFISNFGIAGAAGSFISSIFFGLFGLSAYIFPILLFAGTAFIIANQENTAAFVKALAALGFFIFFSMFLELVSGSREAGSPIASYLWSAEHRIGGGLVGGLLAWLIRPHLGTISAFVIDIIMLIICIVLMTQRSLWKPIQSGSRKVYTSAKNETIRQRQQMQERRQRRIDNKVTGVSTDTSIKNKTAPGASDNINEIRPDPAFVQDFPIYMMNQPAAKQQSEARARARQPKQQEPEIQQQQNLAAAGMGYAQMPSFPENMDLPHTNDKIIPITNRKVALQPSGSVPDKAQAEEALANSSDLFSDLITDMPDIGVGTAGQMPEALFEITEQPQTDFSDSELSDPAGDAGGSLPEASLWNEGAMQADADINALAQGFMPEESGRSAQAEAASVIEWNIVPETLFGESPSVHSAQDAQIQNEPEPAAQPEPMAILIEEPAAQSEPMAISIEELTAQPEPALVSTEELAAQSEPMTISMEEPAAQQEPMLSAEELIAQQLAAAAPAPSQQTAAAAPPPQPAAITQPRHDIHKQPKQTAAQAAASAADVQMQLAQAPPKIKREYVLPPVSLLHYGDLSQTGDTREHLQETALKLQQTLKNFGVNVSILNVSCGPSVTRYEIQPEMGVKVSKIVNLADDIKLNLAAADIRIEAPIPGKAAIGIEVPNKETVPVMFRDLIESEAFQKHTSPCAFAAGKDISGQVVVTDICKMPHLLIAGATGSGKSVCINTIIMSMIYKANPDDVKLIMIDPKVVELSVYNGIPHLLLPVVTDPKKAAGALHWAVSEMMDRYQKFADYGVRDMKGYNAKIKKIADIPEENKPQKMPYIVIIVDELADLMMAAPGDVEDAICRLAQLARAAGIHLIIATQRPSVNVITGLIKANMPSRIAFSVTSGIDSRTILDMNGAEKLLGKGDMLFYPQGYQKPVRVQGAFVSDAEVSDVVEFLTQRNGTCEYSNEVAMKVESAAAGSGGASADTGSGDDRDVYFADAARLLIDKEKASVSMLQRYFKIGFNRAARIMDQLEEAGVVGPEEGTKPRKILMSPEEFAQYEEEVL
ncbi:MAG: DNA translocase FtsK [Eubacterium sp.]|nr:DNA translocase FtsK [Eubacterium sp.]